MVVVVMAIYPCLFFFLPSILPPAGLSIGRTILPFALVSLWLSSIASIWSNALDACYRSDLRAGITIIGSLIFFLFAVIGVKYFGLVGLVVAQAIQGIFLLIAGWLMLRHVMPSLPLLPKTWRFVRFKEMLGYGINFQINSIVVFFF